MFDIRQFFVNKKEHSGDICKIENCSHYIDKKKLHLYRGRYLLCIVVFSLVVFGFLAYLNYSFSNGQERIINNQEKFYNKVTDTTLIKALYNNDLTQTIPDLISTNQFVIQSQMEMQYSKLQSEFNALSIWAAVLMIIFLVFSIYSIFKTDEVLKESKDSLNKVDAISQNATEKIKTIETELNNAIKGIESQASEEKKKLTSKTQEDIQRLKTLIDNFKIETDQIIHDKSQLLVEQFNGVLTDIRQRDIEHSKLVEKTVSDFTSYLTTYVNTGSKNSNNPPGNNE